MLSSPGLKHKNWQHYLKYGERMFFKKNSTIYKEGTAGEGQFYYLLQGVVKVYARTYAGKYRTIEIFNDERIFGEQMADGKPYFSTAIVLEDSVVYRLPNRTINTLLKKDPDLRLLMYDALRNKMELLVHDIAVHTLPAEQLLAYYLLQIWEKYHHQKIPLTQQELSRYTGLTRVTIYKILNKWGSKTVSVESQKIIVNNPKSLKEIVVSA